MNSTYTVKSDPESDYEVQDNATIISGAQFLYLMSNASQKLIINPKKKKVSLSNSRTVNTKYFQIVFCLLLFFEELKIFKTSRGLLRNSIKQILRIFKIKILEEALNLTPNTYATWILTIFTSLIFIMFSTLHFFDN